MSKLLQRNVRCWSCGKKGKLTEHHISTNKEFRIFLCRDCHDIVERVKMIIQICKKEQRFTITRFKQLRNEMEGLE